jgi:hypothetical protein
VSGHRRLALCFILGGGFWSSTTGALEDEPPSIWYRSADGCPDGAAFVGRLHGAAEGAKLASVADRIDFVVTLGMKDGRAFGRLERQTAEGRAAVRELGAATCEEVADAIALTLTLALAPQSSGVVPPKTPDAPPPAPSPPVVLAQTTTHGDTVGPPASPVGRTPPATNPQAQTPERRRRWLLGTDLTADKGSLPDVLLGERLFLEFRPDAPWPGASIRLAGFFTRRFSSTDPAVDVARFGGRLEACPFALESAPLELSPCLGFDAGEELARGTGSSALSDSAGWLAASVFARGTWSVTRGVALEAAAGPTLPLTRYELLEAGAARPLNRTEIVGVSVALGVGFRLR